MLAQILAIAVALGSGLLLITAFVFPKLHRQDDFFWSAVGLFYALVLWVCAGQMAGAVLLGQLASVILLGWLAWEMLRLRQAIADPAKIPDLDKVSLISYVKERFNQPKPAKLAKAKKESKSKSKSKSKPETPVTEPVKSEAIESVTETPETAVEESSITPEAVETALEIVAATEEITETIKAETEAIAFPELEATVTVPEPEVEADITFEPPAIAATTNKKGFSIGRLFGRKDTAPSGTNNPQDLDDIFDDNESESESEPESVIPEAIATATEDETISSDIPEKPPEES